MKPIVIFGGSAIDIISQITSENYQLENSNKGKVKMTEGGSLRNTLECMSKLGLYDNISFITSIGEDSLGQMLLQSFDKLKIETKNIIVKKNERTASFTATLDQKGKFLVGVADMDILLEVPKEMIDSYSFDNTRYILMDSNFSQETIYLILQKTQKVNSVIFEPISIEKSMVLLHKDNLSNFTMIKPNIIQLFYIANQIKNNQQPFENSQDVEEIKNAAEIIFQHARKLNQNSRLEHIICTLGENGVFLLGKNFSYQHINPLQVELIEIKSMIGAGDSFLGGFVAGLFLNKSIESSIQIGQECAVQTIKSIKNVSDLINPDFLN